MVTRRPIQLILVNSPDLDTDYAIIPEFNSDKKITNFKEVQYILTQLNLEVSKTECVSYRPISLKIMSPKVPDLTLIDLPGYIQIPTVDQPADLKRKIIKLCDKYIRKNNIILAISPADSDLANSEALKFSKMVDPEGLRTIGVITKLDLVDDNVGVQKLENRDYPLKLGYIGVVSKDDKFFQSRNSYKKNHVGTSYLTKKLSFVLEENVKKDLLIIAKQVRARVEELKYRYKVEFNDDRISPETYLTEVIDNLKVDFRLLETHFDVTNVNMQIRQLINDKLMDLIAKHYWEDADVGKFEDNYYWNWKLEKISSDLTRMGLGKSSVDLLVNNIKTSVDAILLKQPHIHHPDFRKSCMDLSNELIDLKISHAIEQVENGIKPLKFHVDVTQNDWNRSRINMIDLLQNEMDMCRSYMRKLKSETGAGKINSVIKYLNDPEQHISPYKEDIVLNAKKYLWMRNRLNVIGLRLGMLKKSQCKSIDKFKCPEIYLQLLEEKLINTAEVYLRLELLKDYFFRYPRVIDSHFYYNWAKDDLVGFANQNPQIYKQLSMWNQLNVFTNIENKLNYWLAQNRIDT